MLRHGHRRGSLANPPSMGCDEYHAGAVFGPLSVAFQAAFTNVAVGFNVELQALIEGRLSASVWEFGDGKSRTNQPYTSYAWNSPGVYTLKLTAYNDTHPEGIPATRIVYVSALNAGYYVNQGNPSPAFPYTTWAGAATNIQEAIDAVATGSSGNLC